MSLHTTFKIGGNARLVVYPQNEEQISELVKCAKAENVRLIAVGNGSNLLVDDDGIDACVLILGEPFSQIKLIDDETIYAKAGAKLIALCRFAYEHSLSGLEFAYGIPGSAGGAAFMNAGAYGGEIRDVLVSCKVLKDGKVIELDNEQAGFEYRNSRIMAEKMIVLEAVLKLEKGNKEEISSKMKELNSQRNTKQPVEFPSAGSTFKRPEGYFAAKLIDDSGLRGFSVGKAQVSPKHCGFVVNNGGATAQEVLELIEKVTEIVYDKFGVRLEPEVRIIGQ